MEKRKFDPKLYTEAGLPQAGNVPAWMGLFSAMKQREVETEARLVAMQQERLALLSIYEEVEREALRARVQAWVGEQPMASEPPEAEALPEAPLEAASGSTIPEIVTPWWDGSLPTVKRVWVDLSQSNKGADQDTLRR